MLLCCALASPPQEDGPRTRGATSLLTQAARRTENVLLLGERAWPVSAAFDVGEEVKFLARPLPHAGLLFARVTAFVGHQDAEGNWFPCFCHFDRAQAELAECGSDAEDANDSDEDAPPRRKRKRKSADAVPAGPDPQRECDWSVVWLGFVSSAGPVPAALLNPERAAVLFHALTQDRCRDWSRLVWCLWNARAAADALGGLAPRDAELYQALAALVTGTQRPPPPKRLLLALGVTALPRDGELLKRAVALVPNCHLPAEEWLSRWLRWRLTPGLAPWSLWHWIAGRDLAFATGVIALFQTCVGNGLEALVDLVAALERTAVRPGVWQVTAGATPAVLDVLQRLHVILEPDLPVKTPSLVLRGGGPALGEAEVTLWRSLHTSTADVRPLPMAWSDEEAMGELLADLARRKVGYCTLVAVDRSVSLYLTQVLAARRLALRVHNLLTTPVASLALVPCVVVAGLHVRDTAAAVERVLAVRRAHVAQRDAAGAHATLLLGDKFLARPLGNTAWAAWCHAVEPDAPLPVLPALPEPVPRPAPAKVLVADPYGAGRWVGELPFYHEAPVTVAWSADPWLRYAVRVLRPAKAEYVGQP